MSEMTFQCKQTLQIVHLDIFDEERVFGPVFNDTAFLLPLLKLQQDISNLVAPDGTTFTWEDLIAYTVGVGILLALEKAFGPYRREWWAIP